MRYKLLLIPALIFVGILFNSCKKSGDTVTGPSDENNLIVNSSFESNGKASLQGWNVGWWETEMVHSAHDAPPGGGSWSVEIDNGTFTSGNQIWFTVHPHAGHHVYKFSFWGRYDAGNLQLGSCQGGVLLWLHNNTDRYGSYTKIDTTIWEMYTIFDTLDTYQGDSIPVELDGCVDGPTSAKTYFDLCRLEVLN
ncbi:MAG TPA: hypothetical protein VLX91_01470 [Candidatus Acidoferrales bacterium]|nr:hypothetical protein [Candidatus Acidoferrales bacterium]